MQSLLKTDDYYIIGGLEEKDRKIKKFFDSLIVINIDSSLRRGLSFILPTGARSTYKWMQLNDSIKIEYYIKVKIYKFLIN